MTIEKIYAREVIDSRGNPTIEVEVTLKDGTIGKAIVPSGASTGKNEALELRDNDKTRYLGKGVLKAVYNVNNIIGPAIKGMNVENQLEIDNMIIDLDGTSFKKKLGANSTLGVSLAVAHAAANYLKMPLYRYLGGINAHILPSPLMNVINGGVHADSSIDFQEYFIIPVGFNTFKEALRGGIETFHHLKMILKEKGYSTSVGDEGGFAPRCRNGNEEPLELIIEAIKKAGYTPGKHIFLGIDVASSEFYNGDGTYSLNKSKQGVKTSSQMIGWYKEMCNKYPIITIEDGLGESDWEGWKELTKELGNKIQLVGDDIFVTNKEFLKKGIMNGIANSILIKYNQIGTLSETLETISLAKTNGYTCIISHR